MATALASVLEGYGLLSPYAQYKEQVMVHCPFHSDQTPSLSINFIYQNFRCFSCSREGNAFDLVYELERKKNNNLNVMQATIKARKVLKGVELPDAVDKQRYEYRGRKDRHNTYDEIENVYKFYRSLERVEWTEDTSEYWAFLASRGFDSETLNTFHVRVNRTSTNPIVIPLLEQGNFRGYVARRIDDVKQRKYKNNNGLDKESIVVGHLHGDDIVIVCEGVFDLMMCYQNGYRNVCCLLGCMPSEGQLIQIASYNRRTLWACDSDDAGDKGYRVARNYYERYYKHSKEIRRFMFPRGVNDLGEIKDSDVMARAYEESVKEWT